MHICVYTHMHREIRFTWNTQTHIHKRTHIHTHTCTHTYMHTYTHAQTELAKVHNKEHVQTSTHTHTQTHTHTYIHTQAHIHTHTYIHAHMRTYTHAQSDLAKVHNKDARIDIEKSETMTQNAHTSDEQERQPNSYLHVEAVVGRDVEPEKGMRVRIAQEAAQNNES